MKAAAASTVSCAAIRGVHVRAAVVAVSAVMGSGRSGRAIGGAMLLPPFTLPLPYALRQRVHQNFAFQHALGVRNEPGGRWAEASASFSSASLPPSATARVTQWLRCSSSKFNATERKALFAALIWVRTS